jgi:hypothetical protein
MKGELEPIASDLAELLKTERRVPAAPPDGKARVRARVGATLFGAGGGGGEGGSGGSDLGVRTGGRGARTTPLRHTIATFVLGVAVGGAGVYALLPPRVVERRVEVAAAAPSDDRKSDQSVSVSRIERVAVEEPKPEAGAPPGEPLPQPDSLAAERALLDPARTALARGDGASALEAVRKHEQRYGSGKLAEEREAIATQALVLAGRKEEARARGQRFLARYPGSVLAPMVQAALEAAQ